MGRHGGGADPAPLTRLPTYLPESSMRVLDIISMFFVSVIAMFRSPMIPRRVGSVFI